MFGINPVQFNADVWIVVKAFSIIGLLLYNVFAFVVVKQVTHMTKTLKVGFEGPIILFSVLHMVAALALLVLSIIVL